MSGLVERERSAERREKLRLEDNIETLFLDLVLLELTPLVSTLMQCNAGHT